MSKRTYEELRDMLCHELDVLTKKGEITKDNLDYFYKVTNTLWKVTELLNAEEGNYSHMSNYSQTGGEYSQMMMRGNNSERGYSQGQSYSDVSNRNSYADDHYARRGSYDGRAGRDADNDGRYSENEGNYSRGRNSYGRYSRHTAKERMIEKLEGMADKATNEKDRMAIMDCIEELEK